MAIRAFSGNKKHSIMHDVESFFWLLFWICIHYKEHGKCWYIEAIAYDKLIKCMGSHTFDSKDMERTGFEGWNYEDDWKLACLKFGTLCY